MSEDERNREKELIQKVKTANQQFLSATGNTTHAFIEQGKHLNELKEERKSRKTKRNWIEYIAEEMPWLNKRRAQRAMAAAKVIDLEKCPGLAILSQRKLSKLAAVAKGRPLTEILADKVDCDFSLEDQEKVRDFEEKIDQLFKDLRKEAKDTKGPIVSLKLLSRPITDLEKMVNEIGRTKDFRAQLKGEDLEQITLKLSDILNKIQEFSQASE